MYATARITRLDRIKDSNKTVLIAFWELYSSCHVVNVQERNPQWTPALASITVNYLQVLLHFSKNATDTEQEPRGNVHCHQFMAVDGNPWITMNYHEVKMQHFRWTMSFIPRSSEQLQLQVPLRCLPRSVGGHIRSAALKMDFLRTCTALPKYALVLCPFDGNYSHSFNDFIGRVWGAHLPSTWVMTLGNYEMTPFSSERIRYELKGLFSLYKVKL